MDKSRKMYIMALDKYNNGYIDKAIQLCEESISINIKNSAAINLKGLLYYLKGDLENSQKLWKMNYQVNKDDVSQRYLGDSKEDNERQRLYSLALKFINELKINEALDALKKCTESDYNYINVNNYITMCYFNKGDYDKAAEHIDKVLKLDKNNSIAKENIKILKKYGYTNFNVDLKKVLSILAVIFLIAAIGLSVRYIKFSKLSILNKQTQNKYVEYFNKNIKSIFTKKAPAAVKNDKKDSNKAQDTKKQETNSQDNKAKDTAESKAKAEVEAIPSDKIKADIQNKNFEPLYDEYTKWKDKNISEDDKIIILQAGELLKRESVDYFYNRGCTSLNNKSYSEAKVTLSKAYALDVHSDLYPHVVYMLATSFELSGEPENALKYYIQYDNSFEGGVYQDTVLYKLVILNKDSNKEAAKKYAQKLISKYPQSMYNNSIVNGIANS